MATLSLPLGSSRPGLGPPIAVQALPRAPREDGHYVFDGLGRTVASEGHGLHKYPAKFVPQIPRWALEHEPLPPGAVVLDPFAGSGTTVLEAALGGYRGIGLDTNPLSSLITLAKTAVLSTAFDPHAVVSALVAEARGKAPSLARALVPGETSLGMHRTWSNWFAARELAGLLALRHAIEDRYAARPDEEAFLLVCLSSIAKSCSLLDENQIKVRRILNKSIADPFEAFGRAVRAAAAVQTTTRARLRAAPRPMALTATAVDVPLADCSVDRVITSPPYINAVDYTMNHKYNLFLLGLLDPGHFKDHCRDYIGMTERAVRASDLVSRPEVDHPAADREVSAIWEQGTKTAYNRAFVTAQFFSGMAASFKEIARVLRPGGLAITVIGTENRVCDRIVPTAEVCEALAADAGLVRRLRFFHRVANVSSMRLNRHGTGGRVPTETICVFANDR